MPKGDNPNSRKNLDKSRLDLIDKDKARKIQSSGGKAFGEAVKAEKTHQQNVAIALEYMKKNKLDELKDENMKKFLQDTDVLTFIKCEMVNKSEDDNLRLKTIESIEDRLYGKAKQQIESSGNIAITGLDFEIKK